MKKLLNLCLLLTSLMGYLEWGKGYHSFLFQAEADLFSKVTENPLSMLHPFVLIPLAGQIIMLYALFQKEPGRLLTFTGLGCISLLLLLILFVGILSFNFKIIVSTLPFLITAILVIRVYRKKRTVST